MTKEEQLTKEIGFLKEANRIFAGDICSANNEVVQLRKKIESLKMAMQIHAGDICSANNEADRFIDMNKDLEDENGKLREVPRKNKGPSATQ